MAGRPGGACRCPSGPTPRGGAGPRIPPIPGESWHSACSVRSTSARMPASPGARSPANSARSAPPPGCRRDPAVSLLRPHARRDKIMHGTLRLAFLATLAAVTLVTGTLMAPPARAATFVYVGNAETNEIYVLQLDRRNGDLAIVEKGPIPGIEKPGISTPMSVSPDRRFLYVGTRGEPKVAAGFAIDQSSGKLKHVASGPLADSLAYIATDRTGRFLLGASYPGHKVTVNPIGPPGTVQPPQQVLPNYPNAHAILADAANRHVLVPTLGNDRVNQFTFDATTGKLAPTTSPTAEVKPKAGPRHFVFHPGGKLVYVIGELDGTVYVFDYHAATGGRTEKHAANARPPHVHGKPPAAGLHATPRA